MLDLKAQLGDYLDHVVKRIGVEEIFEERIGSEPVRPFQPHIARRRTPRWVYGIAAVAAVLLVVGGVAWLTRVGGDLPPADEPSATSTTIMSSVPTGDEVSLLPMTATDRDMAFIYRWVDIGSSGSATAIGQVDGLGARFFIVSGTHVETGRNVTCLIDTTGSVSPQCGQAAHRIVYGYEGNGLKYLVGKAPADAAVVAVNLWGDELWQRPVDGFVMFISPVDVAPGETIEWSAYDENARLIVKVSTHVP